MSTLLHSYSNDEKCSGAVPWRKRLINEKEASELVGMTVAWFRKKRVVGGGPEYRKIGSAVRYEVGTLLDFFAAGSKSSTSEK